MTSSCEFQKSAQSCRWLQGEERSRYPSAVAANSATGCESPNQSRRKAPQNLSSRFFRVRYGFMAAVRGRPSGLPVALIAGFSPRARLSPKPVRRLVAAPQIKDVDHEQNKSVQNLAFPSTRLPVA